MKVGDGRPPLDLSLPATLSRGDLDAATACFARDGCLLTADATAIHDRTHIRPLLAQMIDRRTQVEIEQCNTVVAGDVALVRARWTLRADGPEGSRFQHPSNPRLVLHLVEGQWKVAIAALWG